VKAFANSRSRYAAETGGQRPYVAAAVKSNGSANAAKKAATGCVSGKNEPHVGPQAQLSSAEAVKYDINSRCI
jgi:hypothetical protein